jgi:hypothetical protein
MKQTSDAMFKSVEGSKSRKKKKKKNKKKKEKKKKEKKGTVFHSLPFSL